MLSATITKWGNSQGFRFNQTLMNALNIKTGDKVSIEIEGDSLIVKKQAEPKALTFEQLFKDYNGEEFDTPIVIPDRIGNERW